MQTALFALIGTVRALVRYPAEHPSQPEEAIMRLGMPGLALLTIGAAMTLTAAPTWAQEPCAGGREGLLAAGVSPGLTERRFERTDADPDALPLGNLGAILPDADQLRAQFAQVDEDGDGRISREEWMRSFGPTYAARATAVNSSPLGTD